MNGPWSVPRSSPKRRMSTTSPTARQTFSSVVRWRSISASSRRSTLAGFGDQVHQEVVDAAQEGAPLEQVAADDDHQGPVGSWPQVAAAVARAAPRNRRRRRGPTGCAPARPRAPCPWRRGRSLVVGRIAVEVGEAGLVEEGGAERHGGDARAVGREGIPDAVRLLHGVEPGRELHRHALRQGDVVPVRVVRVEGAADVDASMRKRSRISSSGWASCCTTS